MYSRRSLVLFAVWCLSICSLAAQLRKELGSAYDKWATTDVAYIITDNERSALARLQTVDEREQFIEQFWLRRDPTPDTVENEFKEEHYRRIAYANERYASGIPGWKSDRGRIYIAFGPPDEIEAHPSGGSYTRPPAEGGGQTAVFPFERWRYRFLEDVGTDIIIEFVDPTMTGEYRMSIDPNEKDALQHVPRPDRAATPLTEAGGRNQFDRLEQLVNLSRAPRRRFLDLEAAISIGIRYNVLPMKVRADFFPVTEVSSLAYITVQLDNKDLQFLTTDGTQKARVILLGRITTMTRRTAAVFEDTVQVESNSALLAVTVPRSSTYSKAIALAPGTYRLSLIAKDVIGGNTGNYEMPLVVPRLDPGMIQISNLVLADRIEAVPAKSIGSGQLVIGGSLVRPRVDATFHSNEKMGVYLKVYNCNVCRMDLDVTRSTGEKVHDVSEELSAGRSQVTVQRFVDLGGLEAGQYEVRVRVTDVRNGETAAQGARFSVM